jgi:hypothetical protein
MQYTHHVQNHACQQHFIITHHAVSFAAHVTATAAALHSANTVIDATTGELLEHVELIWGVNNGYTSWPMNLVASQKGFSLMCLQALKPCATSAMLSFHQVTIQHIHA